jgi:hypothetical protein
MPPRTIREMPDGLGEEWGRIYIFWRFEKAVANLDILTPSLPLSRLLGVTIRLARFPAARL